MKEKNPLNEYRDEIKKRFAEEGLDNFTDQQALEMLLFYCIPKKDTSDIAHTLLSKFGSLTTVMDAPHPLLVECGLTSNAAVFIKLIPSLCARYHQDLYRQNKSGNKSIEEFILPHFIGQNQEQLFLVLLDAKGKNIFSRVLSRGTKSETSINTQKIVQLGVQYHAHSAVIAHNHPSGIALPSSGDIEMTLRLQKILKNVGITLLDHYIVTGMKCQSMFRIPKYKNLFSQL